jgi:hypothetical protein
MGQPVQGRDDTDVAPVYMNETTKRGILGSLESMHYRQDYQIFSGEILLRCIVRILGSQAIQIVFC